MRVPTNVSLRLSQVRVAALTLLLVVFLLGLIAATNPHAQIPVVSQVVCAVKGDSWHERVSFFDPQTGCYESQEEQTRRKAAEEAEEQRQRDVDDAAREEERRRQDALADEAEDRRRRAYREACAERGGYIEADDTAVGAFGWDSCLVDYPGWPEEFVALLEDGTFDQERAQREREQCERQEENAQRAEASGEPWSDPPKYYERTGVCTPGTR